MRRCLGCAVLMVGAVLLAAGPAAATPIDHPAATSNPTAPLIFFNIGAGHNVSGFIAPAAFNPAGGYPTEITTDFTPNPGGFAGLILASGPPPDANVVSMYCIDLFHETWTGISYTPGTWTEANRPFISRIGQILAGYFPNGTAPNELTDDNDKAAAVQAAVWFFSDHFVLDPADPLYAATAAIVNAVLASPPATEPAPPQLAINGPTSGDADAVVGPYTITTDAPSATLTIASGDLFSDAAGTQPIASPSTVTPGEQFFLRSATPATVTLSVESDGVVIRPGTVLVYVPADAANPNPAHAQMLIVNDQSVVRPRGRPWPSPPLKRPRRPPPRRPLPTTTTTTTTTTISTESGSVGGAETGASDTGAQTAAAEAAAETGQLPTTGIDLAPMVAAGAALLVVGAAATRRRRLRPRR